jgi:dihydrofolate synthase/folylpolyglutamate synthase
MNYSEALNYLASLGNEVLTAKYGLENIHALLERLGRPDAKFKSVVVAGTNGKGSVSAMIESIARAAGHRTGLYTSPHLVRIEERIRVAGREIEPEDFALLATIVRRAAESLVEEKHLPAVPTFFEQVTAIAMCHFSQSNIDLAILEVGIGGRLDATNAVDRILSVVTSIDYDHQNMLGNTIFDITNEKAAIIQGGARAVVGRQRYQIATDVLMRRCLTEKSLPVFANEPTNITFGDTGRMAFDYDSSLRHYSHVLLGLQGRHQADNAAAAIEAAEVLNEMGIAMPREAIIRGLRQVYWPGRLEMIDDRPPILLDGAHNVAGARALRSYLEEIHQGHITLIFGAMNDKDIDGMTTELYEVANSIVLTQIPGIRSATTARLAQSALDTTRNVIFTETVPQALSWARSVTPPGGLICVAGSLYLVGEVKRVMAEEDRQPQI